MAQTKGRFEAYDLGSCKLHVYYTNDVMGDTSYIIEGEDSLVTMEHPLFKENVAEFNDYIEKLGKPIEKIISDYHVGGTGHHDQVMAEGMEEFSKGPAYGGMMKGFQQTWGDTMTEMPSGALQVSSPAAIDAEIAEAELSLASGAELFLGGHGGAARRDAVEFKISYLKKMKELLAANQTAQAFVEAMKKAYPALPGEAGLEELAKVLYQ